MLIVLFAVLLALPGLSFAVDTEKGKVLIFVYTRTGKSMLVARTLQQQLKADVVEIKDLEDRSGTLGYMGAAFDGFFDRHTAIEPARVNVSPYQNIILVSPIWNWKLSTPIHTFIDNNRFDGKKVVMFTTGNNDIRKYEQYDNSAPFLKRFFRDYIRDKSKAVRGYVTASGGEFINHCHISTLEISDAAIVAAAEKQVSTIQCVFSLTEATVSSDNPGRTEILAQK
jgi:menaquinone-dependent protoporphyrinogen IX oxidase